MFNKVTIRSYDTSLVFYMLIFEGSGSSSCAQNYLVFDQKPGWTLGVNILQKAYYTNFFIMDKATNLISN
jgi:hypothetical protein